MPNLRWLKLNKTGLESLPDELSHLMKLVKKIANCVFFKLFSYMLVPFLLVRHLINIRIISVSTKLDLFISCVLMHLSAEVMF